jgi:hypothetical protein
MTRRRQLAHRTNSRALHEAASWAARAGLARGDDNEAARAPPARRREPGPGPLCHNLVVLIHEMYGFGIDPVFWGADEQAG